MAVNRGVWVGVDHISFRMERCVVILVSCCSGIVKPRALAALDFVSTTYVTLSWFPSTGRHRGRSFFFSFGEDVIVKEGAVG